MGDKLCSDQIFDLYRNLIDKASGIQFSSANRVIFESKLRELLRIRKMTPMEYYHYLQHDSEEVKFFLDTLTTNLTSFFRNQSNWDSLIYEIIPDLMKKVGQQREIRIWSAGCSTGEEAYTLAMVFERRSTRKNAFFRGKKQSGAAAAKCLFCVFLNDNTGEIKERRRRYDRRSHCNGFGGGSAP